MLPPAPAGVKIRCIINKWIVELTVGIVFIMKIEGVEKGLSRRADCAKSVNRPGTPVISWDRSFYRCSNGWHVQHFGATEGRLEAARSGLSTCGCVRRIPVYYAYGGSGIITSY